MNPRTPSDRQPVPTRRHRCEHRIGVVFDLDGTLFDSERDGHRIAFNRAFADADLEFRWDVETYRSLLRTGGGRRRIEHYLISEGWSHHRAQQTAALVHDRKTELMVDLALAGRIPLRPGVRPLLRELTQLGAELHIATTGSARWVKPLLDVTFGTATFGVVVTGDDVLDLKPAPDVYRQVAQGASLDPLHLVAVEDSAIGLAAAQSAGLSCVVVTNPYTPDDDFAGAALVCSDFGELTAAAVLTAIPCPRWQRQPSAAGWRAQWRRNTEPWADGSVAGLARGRAPGHGV